MEFSAKQIAEFLQGTILGNPETVVNSFTKIEEGKEGALTFLSNPKYEQYLYSTKASVVLVNKDFKPSQETGVTLIQVEDAYQSLAKLLSLYDSLTGKRTGISSLSSISGSAKIAENAYIGPFAVVEDGAVIGEGAQIYPYAYVGNGVSIGQGTTLYPHATVYKGCKIGNNCILHAGCSIGADGFGFAPGAEGYSKIPQIGIVEIEDNVEIGANACVDRATMGRTLIHKGVKLDNMVQIAHNVEVGEHTVMSAQTGVAGSAKIGSWSMFGGQCGIAGHITLGDRLQVGAQSGIAGPEKGGRVIMGYPAMDHAKFARSSAIFKKLPDMYFELAQLQKEVKELKEKLSSKQ